MIGELVGATTNTGTPAWVPVATAGVGALGVGVGAAITPLSERFTRKDKLKSYKRIIYRNFLHHAYRYRTLEDPGKRQDHKDLYIADWYRIELITDDRRILEFIEGLKDPESLTGEMEEALLKAFVGEIGSKGLADA